MTVDWSLLVPRIVVCVWHQSIIWTNAEILSTYFSGRLLEIKTISLKKSLWKCHFKILPTILSRSQCVKSLLRYRVQFPTQIAMFMGPTWGPSGSCRSQMGPMMTSWTVLSGIPWYPGTCRVVVESRICSYCKSFKCWSSTYTRPEVCRCCACGSPSTLSGRSSTDTVLPCNWSMLNRGRITLLQNLSRSRPPC